MTSMEYPFSYLKVSIQNFIAEVILNRPEKLNVMDINFFDEVGKCFKSLDIDDTVRVIIIWAKGKVFTAGLDLVAFSSLSNANSEFENNVMIWKLVKKWQSDFKSIYDCKKVFFFSKKYSFTPFFKSIS